MYGPPSDKKVAVARKEEYYRNQSPNKKYVSPEKFNDISPKKEDGLMFEAKKVLDMHINYLTKDCYYHLRNEIM